MSIQRLNPEERKVSPKLTEAYSLPARFYTDREVLQEEIEHIFSKTWQYVGNVNQVIEQGDYFTCEVAQERLVIIRDKDDQVKAFYNVCPHRGGKIADGQGNRKILQCPYHGWTFKTDGSLNKAPNFQGVENFDPAEFCLQSVNLSIQDPFIFVNLDPHAAPIEETVESMFNENDSYQLGTLKKAHTIQYTIKANWKLVVDNFLECYHCPVAHPGFVDVLDMQNYSIHLRKYHSVQGAPVKATGPSQPYGAAENLQEAEVQEGRYYWLWPNMMLNIYPGPGNMSTNKIIPIDHETTLAVYEFYFKDENPTPEQKELIKFIDQVQQEDIIINEYVQQGYRSRAFNQGRYAMMEKPVHHFHLLMQDALLTVR
jgi:phenylpropionate dioxygenase-like ring-hydroxylating dioxygenase large terminal subunit